MTNSSNQLMACFVELSSNKERATLEQSVVKTLCQLLRCNGFLIRLYDGRGEFDPQLVVKGDKLGEIEVVEVEPASISAILPHVLSGFLQLLHQKKPQEICLQQGFVLWPLYSGEACTNVVVIDWHNDSEIDHGLLNAIGCIYTNFLSLLEASERDALTGLYNRRVFDTRLSSLVRNIHLKQASAQERRKPASACSNYLGIIDIDFFKRVNDDFGHLFGDEVLLWLAQNMRHCFRNEDSLFRYGGEEFAVLLSGLTQQQAHDAFERFRKTIASTNFPQIGQITVSIGYSSIERSANPTLVFGEADKALYYAKEHGRNRVECFELLLANGQLKPEQNEMADIELF